MYRPNRKGKVYMWEDEAVVNWRWHKFLVGWFLGTLVMGIVLVIDTFF